MYDSVDIKNILFNTEDCPKLIGDNICKKVKKGKTSFSTTDIDSYISIKYLLEKGGLRDYQNTFLIDLIQDICDKCDVVTEEAITPDDTDCDEDNIITEDDICMITENNINIITE